MLNGTAWHDADFDDVPDTNERPLAGLDGRALSQRPAGAFGAHGRERRLSHQRRPAERHDGESYELRFRAPGAGPNTAQARQSALGLHERPAAHHRHRRARRQQPAESESADRSERRRLQLDLAHADRGRRRSRCSRPAAVRRCRRAASTIRLSRTRSRWRAVTTSSTSTSPIPPARAAATT